MRGVGSLALCACAALPGLTPAPARAVEPTRTVFGTLPDGRTVE